MGLDMYLEKRKQYRENDPEYNKLVDKSREEVMYWRKANQVREWFVRNAGLEVNSDCEVIEISEDQLEQLYDDCNKVIKNPKLASEVMPTSSGFFFGSTEYNERYFDQLKETMDSIQRIFDTTDFDTEVIEYTEWW